jgi:Rrf2 family protein
MVELAARYEQKQPVQIKTIAEAHKISPRFLVQILLQMKGAGLVASSRGASGGYQLTRRPAAVSLAEIITVIDGPPSVLTRRTPLPPSPVVRALHGVWQEIQREEQRTLEKTQRVLDKTTLADLVERSRPDDSVSYQI